MVEATPFRGERRASKTGPPSGQGGGPEDPDMENRVTKLEQQFASIDAKLAKIETLPVQLAEIKGQLSQMPKATDVANMRAEFHTSFGVLKSEIARLDGRVSTLPTMWQTILGFMGIILAILWKAK